MPRYFFNVSEEGYGYPDDVGSELAGLEEARYEAVGALEDISRGKLPNDGNRRFVVEVHEGDGPAVFRASLILKLEDLRH